LLTFYFILKWTPRIVGMMGFAASSAGGVLAWANFGGAAGGAIFGFLASRISLRKLSIVILFLTAAGVTVFGNTPNDLATMGYLAAVAGFFGNAGVSGLYSLIAYGFPTHVRATGTGFVIGVGRGGAVLSPILAGYLIGSGNVLPTVGMIMAAGSLIAAVVLMFLKLETSAERERRTGMEPPMARARA
jgi:MFS family permease